MRFLLFMVILVFMALISIGITKKLENTGEEWNFPVRNTKEDNIVFQTNENENLQSRLGAEPFGSYERFGYTIAREDYRELPGKLRLGSGVPKKLSGNPEVAGNPEVDGSPEVDGKAECKARICDVATCECVDNWDLFSTTCNLMDRQFCTANVEEVIENDGTYHTTFEAQTNFNNTSQTTIHVITTDRPIFDESFDYGSYAITGKMRTYNLDGSVYCMDAWLHEGIDKDDCWYDVRLMGHQPLCPKKRKFFNIDNHADVLFQLRYQSDLERGEPSMMKPPFACMRLCNPLIESSKERGFIAANPGKKLQKCVPKQIQVDRTHDPKANTAATVFEAQILINAANDQDHIGKQWNEYHKVNKTMDHLQLGVNNDDLTTAAQSLKDEYAKCKDWLPAHKAKEVCDDEGNCKYELGVKDVTVYYTRENGTIASVTHEGLDSELVMAEKNKLGDETAGAIPFEDNGALQIMRLIDEGKSVMKIKAPQEVDIDKVSIIDQTWRNGDEIHGVATLMMTANLGLGDILTCYKLCLGDYEPGNTKCDDGAHRTLDCEKVMSAETRMDLEQDEYLRQMDME